jgi:dolichol-phosphate mannosyltransferase
MAQTASHPLLLVTNGELDFAALTYLVPLAGQYPIVWGYASAERPALRQRLLSWGYNRLTRWFLGSQVRDCRGGMVASLFQKAALAEVLPESRGFLAPAEVLFRAGQRGLPVAEVAIPRSPDPAPPPAPGWRRAARDVGVFLSFWWSKVQFPAERSVALCRGAWLPGLLLLLLAGLLLFPELNQPLSDPAEGRQAEIPREMLAHEDLILPRLLGLPYYEKPPLQYWLTAAVYLLFGLHAWVARLVPACAAWLSVLITYAWGRRFLGTRTAFLGGLILCLSLGFVTLGRTVVLDSLLAAWVLAAACAAQVAVSRARLHRGWWIASAVACGLGILTKGPVALALVAPPVFLYALLTASATRPGWRWWSVYVGVAAAVAAPWYLAMAVRDPAYLEHFLWRDNVLRFVQPFDHQQPWWYYLPILFAATLPWSLLWPWLGYFLTRRSRRLALLRAPGLGFCALLAAWCLLFFSLSGCKSPPYLAPVFAPLALLLGACVEAILFRRAGSRDHYLEWARQRLPRRATRLMLALSAGCFLVDGICGWDSGVLVAVEVTVTLGLLGAWWRWGRRARPLLTWGACTAATVLLITMAARDLLVGFTSRHTLAGVAKTARRWPGGANYPVISYRRQWPSASFYLRRDMVLYCEQRQPLIDFLRTQVAALVLVESGPPLNDLLQVLPRTLETVVHLPEQEGQAALVEVRQSGH